MGEEDVFLDGNGDYGDGIGMEIHDNDIIIADLIAKTVLDTYTTSIPKKGKPLVRSNGLPEWTIVAGIVQKDGEKNNWKCVAIGSGVKCLPECQYSPNGTFVNDSHAEILCRRAFLKYLYNQLEQCLSDSTPTTSPSIFTFSTTTHKFTLNPNISFHFYVSHAPCGDCSMEAVLNSQTDQERLINETRKRKFEAETTTNITTTTSSSSLTPPNIHRGRTDIHCLGILRTKPGRIDSQPAHSLSCSDKIARWTILGIQGSLLSYFLTKPIYLSTLVIGDFFDADACERALHSRTKLITDAPSNFGFHPLRILHTKLPFEYSKPVVTEKYSNSVVAADKALLWCTLAPSTQFNEVLVNGVKQGASPRSPKSRSSVCKLNLFKQFALLHAQVHSTPWDPKTTYHDAKRALAKEYTDTRRLVYDMERFSGWIVYPEELCRFNVEGEVDEN